MNVLSLFDGMSCGQIALKQLGIIPDVYYASEIDKHAIRQTQLNFPNTIQLGSVTDVDVRKLGKIDLLIGGSPCQSFSFAGKRVGMSTIDKEEIYTLDRYIELKKEGFEFEGESYLFWEYMRILTDIRKLNPDVKFILENVEMGKKWERVLSEAVGVYGVHINSALVSAQNRKRIYWTNIQTKQVGLFGGVHSDIPQPKDKGILLRDILENKVDEKYFLSDKRLQFMIKNTGKIKEKRSNIQSLEPRSDGKKNCLTNVQKDKLIIQLNPSKESGGNQPYQQNRIYHSSGISPTLTTERRGGIYINELIRRLTPTECARLQTIPEWYKWECSDTQQYKMLGNGWTVDVISHILKFMSYG